MLRHRSKGDDGDDKVHAFNDNSVAAIRKVRSLDFGMLGNKNALYGRTRCDEDTTSCTAASKFSHAAQQSDFVYRPLRRTSRPASLSRLLLAEASSSDTAESDFEETTSETSQGNFVMRLISGQGRSPWSLGYFSVLLLIFMTFTNFALEIVHAQMHQLDSPYYYDALSTEVISPPFRYKVSVLGERRRLGLGSAAISSVTSALSPILPFTGGVDLRRQEHWDTNDGWFNTLTSVVNQVREAFGLEPVESPGASILSKIPRAGGQPSTDIRVKVTASGAKRRKTENTSTLSAAQPFIPVSTIAELTLADITAFFRYAINNNRVEFDRSRFLKGVTDRVKPLLAAMDVAIANSRGKDVEPARTGNCVDPLVCKNQPLSPSVGFGDVDALQFCAAMRMFAEWRVVRQVPDGYKGYAVGMNLGHKDIVQNVAKIESAVHSWIDHRRDLVDLERTWFDTEGLSPGESMEDVELRSPTLRDLLQHEIDLDVHPNNRLPRLKDKTAAMGLLWVRRQLHYQTSLFANIIKVPDSFNTANAAVSAAYAEVYGNIHGWAVQKIFNYSFQAAPQVEEIYKFMNPHRLRDVMRNAQNIARTDRSGKKDAESAIDVEGMEFSSPNPGMEQDTTLEEMNPVEKFGNHLAQEWDKIGKHIGGEWDKLVDSVVRVFDQDGPKSSMDMRGGASNRAGLEGKDLELYVTKEMATDAHENIFVYLDTVQPLLQDLAGLFDDLNMDDPSKV